LAGAPALGAPLSTRAVPPPAGRLPHSLLPGTHPMPVLPFRQHRRVLV